MDEWYCIANGQRYGPVSLEELKKWVASGRVKPTDTAWGPGMQNWAEIRSIPALQAAGAPAYAPTPPGYSAYSLKPHRGAAVLVLGILGLVVCFILGIIAWVMGSNDLRDMNAGVMDPSGRSLTNAGRICGMIATILAIAGAAIWFLIAVLAGIR